MRMALAPRVVRKRWSPKHWECFIALIVQCGEYNSENCMYTEVHTVVLGRLALGDKRRHCIEL